MRESYQQQLAMLERRLLFDLDLAIATLAVVGDAVKDTAGLTPASIERNAERLRSSSHELDQKLITTMALQAPVAEDLRERTLALIETAHHVPTRSRTSSRSSDGPATWSRLRRGHARPVPNGREARVDGSARRRAALRRRPRPAAARGGAREGRG